MSARQTRLRYALVGPTKNRPDLFAQAVAAIRPQVDVVVTVCDGEAAREYAEPLVDLLEVWTGEWNISRLWNLGLDLIETHAAGRPYDVAVLNDDAIAEPAWFETIAATMHTAKAAGASGSRQANKLATLAGYAFVLDGTKGVRADEAMRHWFSDDSLQKRCVEAGGFVAVNGIGAANLRADTEIKANPTLRDWSREDRETFRRTYGEFILPSNVHRGKGRVPLVISATSGKVPTHLLDAAGNRPILVLTTPEWEDQHLRYAADTFDWFVFVKESTRILDPAAFWTKVDAAKDPAWLFAWPSCYMGLYARSPLQTVLRRIKVVDKWGSVREEAALAKRLNMRNALWPEVCDANALRVETVDSEPELVIGNAIIEKSKGSAWCGRCEYDPPGVCDDLLARFKVAA
jgi:hypothetical protein